MHTTLDGFVAGPNGEMDWINVDEEMFDHAGDQTDAADTAVYGRVTYQMMDNYWPSAGKKPGATKHDIQHSAWYNNVEKIVFSKTMRNANLENTIFFSDDIAGEVLKLKHAAGKNIIMFGSPTVAHTLIANDLVDQYWLFVNPILLGEGIPLFKSNNKHTKIKFVESLNFKSGVVCLHYEKDTI